VWKIRCRQLHYLRVMQKLNRWWLVWLNSNRWALNVHNFTNRALPMSLLLFQLMCSVACSLVRTASIPQRFPPYIPKRKMFTFCAMSQLKCCGCYVIYMDWLHEGRIGDLWPGCRGQRIANYFERWDVAKWNVLKNLDGLTKSISTVKSSDAKC